MPQSNLAKVPKKCKEHLKIFIENALHINASSLPISSQIILVISNQTHAGALLISVEFTPSISDQIAMHSVQFPILTKPLFDHD